MDQEDDLQLYSVTRMRQAGAASELMLAGLPERQAWAIAQRVPERFPFVVNGHETPVASALLHCLAVYQSCSKSGQPTKSLLSAAWRAYDLRDWFEAIDVHAADFTAPTQSLINSFAIIEGERISERTGSQISIRTVARKMSSVAAFLKSPEYRRIGNAEFDPRLIPECGRYIFPTVHPLQTEDWESLRSELGPMPSERIGDAQTSVTRLICEWGLRTGMRRFEIVHLRLPQITAFKLDPDAPDKPVVITLLTSKGGYKRRVWVPASLILETLDYVARERAEAVAATGLEHDWIFVNPCFGRPGPRRHIGRRVQPASVSRWFRRAADAAGIRRQSLDPLAPARIANHTFHDLRHTYAVWTYLTLTELGVRDPWKRIQSRLGHRFLQTTLDIYLAHIDEAEPMISDLLQRELNLMIAR